jgi:tetratricopeptide (TPR) repeat protein
VSRAALALGVAAVAAAGLAGGTAPDPAEARPEGRPALAPASPATAPELTREEALAALAETADADRRRHGALRLAEMGTMADVPALVAALRDADPLVRGLAERALWQVWSRSGDAATDRLFAEGLEQMSARQGEQAIETFTRVIERRPDFAEGWNKRATVYYLVGEYAKSLADCDEVVRRNPHHFGALSGYGMIYLKLDQPARALQYFERALAVNPNLEGVRETADTLRRMLIEQRRNTL